MSAEETTRQTCPCGHRPTWHHDERGCGYHGHGPHACPCALSSDDVVDALATTLREQVAAVEALRDEYGRQARAEGYGGEPWSTTEAAISAALSSPGTALAKVRAEAKVEGLREASADVFDTAMPAFVAQWLRERADRIEREAPA